MKRIEKNGKRMLCLALLLFGSAVLAPAAHAAFDEETLWADGGAGFSAWVQGLSMETLLEKFAEVVRSQAVEPLKIFARLAAVLFLCAGISGFASEETCGLKPVLAACTFLQAGSPTLHLLEQVGDEVLQCAVYLSGFVPAFAGVLASCGQPSAATLYGGMFLGAANLAAQAISSAVLPVLQVFLAVYAAACICGLEGMPDAAKLLLKAAKWMVSLISMLLGGVLGLQSLLAQGSDSLALQTGRFLTGSIPIVGQLASSAAGSVLAGLRVLKGTLGAAAIGFLVIQFGPVLLQCAVYELCLRLSGALAEALGLESSRDVLNGLAEGVGLCMAILILFFLMVVLVTAFMILLGGS